MNPERQSTYRHRAAIALAAVTMIIIACQATIDPAPTDPPKPRPPRPMEPVRSTPDPKPVPVASKSAIAQPTTQPLPAARDDSDTIAFAQNAFPPPIPDTRNHRDAWRIEDCLRCHLTGVADAPMVMHTSVPDAALTAKCRTCHVLIPGLEPRPAVPTNDGFLDNAFPPMIPASASHPDAWRDDNCLLCHEVGVRGAPVVRHEGMPPLLLQAKCRSCHVQARGIPVPR